MKPFTSLLSFVSPFFISIVASLILLFALIPSVFALTVSPPSLEITGDPGTKVTGEIELFNEQETAKTFYSSFENFEPSGETGAPHFIGADGDLATWIKTDAKVTLEPSERKVIPFTITIPKDTEPGGYFAAVFWGLQPPVAQDSGDVSVGAKVGVLMFLRVSGEVPEGGGLLSFNAKDDQKVFNFLPVNLEYRLNNAGGDRVIPVGEVVIKNLFGSVAVTLPANDSQGNVLPSSTRRFEVSWQEELDDVQMSEVVDEPVIENDLKPGFFEIAGKQWSDFHFGLYTANLDLSWGLTDQTATAKYRFFMFPWQLLLIVFVILLIVGVLGVLLVKKYNQWLIAKVTQQQQAINQKETKNE